MISLKLTPDDVTLLADRQAQIDDPNDTLWGTAIIIGDVRIELGSLE